MHVPSRATLFLFAAISIIRFSGAEESKPQAPLPAEYQSFYAQLGLTSDHITKETRAALKRPSDVETERLSNYFLTETSFINKDLKSLIGEQDRETKALILQKRALVKFYIAWYVKNAQTLLELDLSLATINAMIQTLRDADPQDSRVVDDDTRPFLNEKDLELRRSIHDPKNPSRSKKIAELMLKNNPQDDALIRISLSNLSQTYAPSWATSNDVKLETLVNIPKRFKWIVGLGELVMDGDSNLSEGTTLSDLYSRYLAFYRSIMRDIVVGDQITYVDQVIEGTHDSWIKRVLIGPLVLIAESKAAPEASEEALKLLGEIADTTNSPQVTQFTRDAVEEIETNARNSNPMGLRRCEGLLNRLGRILKGRTK